MLNQNQVIKMPRFLFDLSLLQFIMNNQNRYTNKIFEKAKNTSRNYYRSPWKKVW